MSNLVHSYSFALFREILNDVKIDKYLDRLKAYHLDTYEHSARVSLLSIDLGIDNNLEDDLRVLGYGGLLHDIGKIEVPLEILSKQDVLDLCERSVIKKHPRTGYNMLEGFNQDVRKIVLGHHEYKKDPYPRKDQKGNKRIRMLTQIVSTADIFDALLSRRSYKEPMQKDEIERIIRSDFTGNKNT